MSLTKREEQEVLWKLKRADEEQEYRLKEALGLYRVAEEIFERFEKHEALKCLKCNEQDNITKYGKDADGQQRYRCKECGRTFVERSTKPFFKSDYSDERWKAFLTSMLGGATLESLSEKYDVCIQTAHRWRIKLLDVVQELVRETWLAGRVWADEAFLNMNEPGRGKDGIEGLKTTILTGQDYKNRTFAVPVGPGRGASTSDISQTLEKYLVEESSTLVTDNAKNFSKYCEDNGVEHDTNDSKSDDMNMINWLHSHFKTWYKQFRGVGADYLPKYCAWFAFLKNNPGLRAYAET